MKQQVVHRAVIYSRVSTSDQRASLDMQIDKCRLQAALMDNVEVIEVIEDFALSGGSTDKREGFKRMISMIKTREIDTIIAWKIDRIGRSLHDIASLVKLLDQYGASLIAISDGVNSSNPSMRLTLNLLSCISQNELEVIKTRTHQVLRHKKIQGLRYSGVVPYSMMDVDGKLIPNPDEVRVIGKIMELRKSGLSFEKIAAELNANSIPTRRGAKRWIWTAVRSVIYAEEAKLSDKLVA